MTQGSTQSDESSSPKFKKESVRKLSVALMWLLAVMNLGFLLWVVIDPFPVARFVGLTGAESQAQVELRAMYGGLIGGIGVLNLLGALNPQRLNAALWCTAWTFTGVGMVRSLSCLTFGIGGVQALFALSEIGAAVTCFMLLSFLEKESGFIQ